MEYSFCETLVAYVWHIRPLTDQGRKNGGGADTLTLCGLKPLWDINTPINLDLPLDGICSKCSQIYMGGTLMLKVILFCFVGLHHWVVYEISTPWCFQEECLTCGKRRTVTYGEGTT
jgi:hypothetical protein